MALPCYAHKFCLNRSLQICWHSPSKSVVLCSSWYLMKKELSSHSDNDSTEISSGTHNETDSQKKPTARVVSEEVTVSDSTNFGDDIPEEPTTCCMSGCANCVWIEYAEELSKRYRDGGEKAREAIMKISDPNMRAFLLTELKTKVT